MPAASAQTLITAAQGLGYDSLSDRGIKECTLYAISAGGGGGGGGSGSVEQGNGPPAGIPTDPLQPAIYTDLLTTFVWSWDVANQTWALSSTSGGNALSQGHGDPISNPTDPTAAALYVDLDTYVIWTWNVGDQAWH